MRTFTILALSVALFFAHQADSSCFEPAGDNITLIKGCTSGEDVIWSKADQFTVKVEAGTGEVNSKGSLSLGGCGMEVKLIRSDTETILKVGDKSIDLPTTATVKKGSVSFSRKGDSPYVVPAPCSPVFKQVGDGHTVYVGFKMDPAATDFKITFNGVSLYSRDASKEDPSTKWLVLIVVLGIVLFFILLVVGAFICIRWRKKQAQAKRAKEEADAKTVESEKPEAKKVELIVNQVDETKPESKKAVVKKDEMKEAKAKKDEVKKAKVEKDEMKEAKVKKDEVKKAKVEKDEVKEAEVKKDELKEAEVKKDEGLSKEMSAEVRTAKKMPDEASAEIPTRTARSLPARKIRQLAEKLLKKYGKMENGVLKWNGRTLGTVEVIVGDIRSEPSVENEDIRTARSSP